MPYDDRDDELDAEIKKLQPSEGIPTCPSCGSDKIVPNVDFTGGDGRMMVYVMADPDAMIFKGIESEQIKARLCGACGYLALHAENPARLWSVYQRTVTRRLKLSDNPGEP